MFTRRSSSSCDGNLSSREGLTQSQQWNSLPWKSSEIRVHGKSQVEGGKEATPGKGSAGQGRQPGEAPSTGGTGWMWAWAGPRKRSESARPEMRQERQRLDHSRCGETPWRNLTATKTHLKCSHIEAKRSDTHFEKKNHDGFCEVELRKKRQKTRRNARQRSS